MGVCVSKGPCPNPECGSSDACATYDDGTAYCWSCNSFFNNGGERVEAEDTGAKSGAPMVTTGFYRALPDRKLTEETCKKWQYQCGEYSDKTCQIANYRDVNNKLVSQKIRMKGKQFAITGDGKNMPLYGQWLWRDGGKSVTICEGEIDAMSMSQAFDHKWPVVSIPNGAGKQTATQVAKHFEWLDKFDSIILMFDQDEAGERAVAEIVDILPVGKVKVATLPEKDANDTLIKHGPAALVNAFWSAKSYSPVGILSGADITMDALRAASTKGYTIRIPQLNERLLGVRKGEITLLTAASGIGKSTLLRQLCYELQQDHACKIGNLYLEENNVKTAQAYVALDNNVPLGKLRYDGSILTDEQWAKSKATVVNSMWFYNHFGSLDSKRLISKIRYMATALKVDFIALDHISIVTSGLESSKEGERKDIDILMTNLRSVVEETGVGVIGVVHLKRVTGKNFNEGAQVSLTDLRGSASLEQLSDNVIALERDQQGEDNTEVSIRVLKCRETGETGEADTLDYKRDTGKLVLASAVPMDAVNDTDEDVPF